MMSLDCRSAERLGVLVVEPRELVAARLEAQLERLGHCGRAGTLRRVPDPPAGGGRPERVAGDPEARGASQEDAGHATPDLRGRGLPTHPGTAAEHASKPSRDRMDDHRGRGGSVQGRLRALPPAHLPRLPPVMTELVPTFVLSILGLTEAAGHNPARMLL